MEDQIKVLQTEVKNFVREYGLSVAVEGTKLSLYNMRKTYTDADPDKKNLAVVISFYRELKKKDMDELAALVNQSKKA